MPVEDAVILDSNAISCIRAGRVLFADLTFCLKAGELLHIKGHNGSGKTSLLKLLAGLATPDAGTVLYHAIEHDRLFLGHLLALKNELTVRENLLFWLAIAHKPKSISIKSVLQQSGLQAFAHDRTTRLSAGQKQRLALSRLLVSSSKLWLLDEPYTHLDQEAKSWLSSLLVRHLLTGGSVVMTAHDFTGLETMPHNQIVLSS